MGGLAAEAAGGDFKTGALVAGANEALIDTLANQYDNMSYEQRSGLLTMNSQVLGVLVASVAGGDEKDMQTGAWVAGNATSYNRQLHPDERELAARLAEQSEGKYTSEQIEEQLRLSYVKGTDITPAHDFVVSGSDGIYDPNGQWIALGDQGYYLQDFPASDSDVISYIQDNLEGVYSWTTDAEFGYTRLLDLDYAGERLSGKRDRLTGYMLDENNGYRVPVVVDGKAYSPRFYQCANAECLAVGSNIDFSDLATLGWIRAVDVNAVARASERLAIAAVIAPSSAVGALSLGSTGLGLVAGYLADTKKGTISATALGIGFTSYASARGLTPVQATRLNSAIEAAGGWAKIADKIWN
jgi:filamentous hemagglutinin